MEEGNAIARYLTERTPMSLSLENSISIKPEHGQRRWRCWGLHSKSQQTVQVRWMVCELQGKTLTAPSPCNPSTQCRTSWRIFLPPMAPFLTHQVKFGILCSPLEDNSYSLCKLYTRYTIQRIVYIHYTLNIHSKTVLCTLYSALF